MLETITHRIKRWVQPELDRTHALLKQANTQLDHALRENMSLKNRNEELNVQVHRLEADNRDLHHQLDLLRAANKLQAEAIDRMERHQRELQDKYDNMVARVMQLEAKLGIL